MHYKQPENLEIPGVSDSQANLYFAVSCGQYFQ